MINDIVLPITDTRGDGNALAAALAMAAYYGAHLSVIEPLQLPLPAGGPWGFSDAAGMERIHEELRGKMQQEAARIRAQLEKEEVSSEVVVAESMVDRALAVVPYARHADLAMLTAPEAESTGASSVQAFFSALLFGSGRPVLVVPAKRPADLPVRHAVIGWRPTREATRAVHDALPILARTTSIDVLTIDPDVSELDHGQDPGVDIATHLARHGLSVNVISRPEGGQTIAAVLLRHAMESGAQLLVVGGYGHTRLREWALGGTTRELLRSMHLPVLFSH